MFAYTEYFSFFIDDMAHIAERGDISYFDIVP